MVEVIKEGDPDPKVKFTDCPNCNSELKYTREDMEFELGKRQRNSDRIGGQMYDAVVAHLPCPVCDCNISLGSKQYGYSDWDNEVESPYVPDDMDIDIEWDEEDIEELKGQS